MATETLTHVGDNLIEKWTHKKVANHMLDAKLFSKLGANDLFVINPAAVHFAGFSVGKTISRTFEVANRSDIVQRLHILPPQSSFFKISYTKKDRFAPGCTLKCKVEFCPTEWRYYYDCIRLHCPEEENLIIPIHAYPVADASAFPSVLTFNDVTIGERAVRTIPLKSHVPVDFNFTTKLLQKSQSFSVSPRQGVVPKNGEAIISVTYLPKRFATESVRFQLDIAQFDAPHFVCLATGSCSSKVTPNDPKQNSIVDTTFLHLDPITISPLARARLRYSKSLANDLNESNSIAETADEENKNVVDLALVQNVDLWKSQTVVNRMLLHDPTKVRSRDLRPGLAGKRAEESRHAKTAKFENELRNADYKEKQNQLIWQTTLGSQPLKESAKEKILNDRRNAWRRYTTKRGDVTAGSYKFDDSSSYTILRVSFRRTYRLFDLKPVANYGNPTFDPYENDFWQLKMERIERFQQLSRALLIRNRANDKISGLKKLKAAFDVGRRSVNPEDIEERKSGVKQPDLGIPADAIAVARRKYVSELPIDVKENITDIPISNVAFWLSPDSAFDRKPVYHQIRVARQFQILGFGEVPLSNLAYASRSAPNRTIRVGAEDELTVATNVQTDSATMQTDNQLVTPSVAHIHSPEYLSAKTRFSASRYAGNGLTTFFQALPYSEGTADFPFCPVARYSSPRSKGPPNALHERDVIKGLMTWRNLPAAGPLATATLPCSTQLLSLRFAERPEPVDLLPPPPTFLRKPPEADKEFLDELESNAAESSSSEATLTPESVAARFEILTVQMAKPLADRAIANVKGRKGFEGGAAKARDHAKKSEQAALAELEARPPFRVSSRSVLYNNITNY